MIRCAIIGATGIVGQTFLKVLEEKKLDIDEYILFASNRSNGKKIDFMNEEYYIQELNEDSFSETKFDFALFSAGSEVSKKYAPIAAKSGCIVIDNSSHYRMYDNVPLVVPEVNPNDIFKHSGIIANPNCATIQATLPIKAIMDKYPIKRIVFSTYQSVSGAGNAGINDLISTRNNEEFSKFKYNISNNCIPQIDSFLENNYTKEEMKIIEEIKRILNIPTLPITGTCVRVPILNCHCESINLELSNEFNIEDITNALSNFNGITVIDNVKDDKYPINELAINTNDVLVGRIRKDYSVPYGINIWVVSDNLRKGAATNAIQILEKLIQKGN